MLSSDFIQWTKLVDKDYTLHDFYNRTNTFTFNYGTAAFTQMELHARDFGEVYIDMHLTQTDPTQPMGNAWIYN